jgi:hypothetical protein
MEAFDYGLLQEYDQLLFWNNIWYNPIATLVISATSATLPRIRKARIGDETPLK